MNASAIQILKILEVVLTLICVILMASLDYIEGSTLIMCAGTFIGYLVITSVILLGIFIKWDIHKNVDLLFVFVGLILFAASGILAIHDYDDYRGENRSLGLGMGSVALIVAVCLAVDVFLGIKK